MGAIVSQAQGTSGRSPSEQNSQCESGHVEDDSSIKINQVQYNDPSVKWKILPSADEAKAKFQKDGSLSTNNIDQLELRMMLDDPIAQR